MERKPKHNPHSDHSDHSYIFDCENCHQTITGGQTLNHCPYCLWSKHIAFYTVSYPPCGGLMKPVKVLLTNPFPTIQHRCECGFEMTGQPVNPIVYIGQEITISWMPYWEELHTIYSPQTWIDDMKFSDMSIGLLY